MENMNGKKPKILITGGLGYIGSHTATVFAEVGYDVVIIDNLANSYMGVLGDIQDIIGKKIPFYSVDMKNIKEIEKVFKEHPEIEGVIHFASLKSVGESCEDPISYYENNIIGTMNLIKVLNNIGVKNLIFSSSATVYDANNILPPFSENDRLNTTNPYGTTKLINEYLLRDLALFKGFNVINLRYFNPIGAHHSGILGENPKGNTTNILPVLLDVAIGKIDQFKVLGDDYRTEDGTGIRDYIHVMDIAEAHLLAFKYIEEFEEYKQKEHSDERKGLYDVFNLGIGEGMSVKQMIELVESITEKSISYKILGRRPGDVDIAIANSQKAKQVLGWSAKRTVYQAVEDAWKFKNQLLMKSQ